VQRLLQRWNITLTESQKIAIPAILTALGICLVLVIHAFHPLVNPDDRLYTAFLSLFGLVYISVLFLFLLPRYERFPNLPWLIAVFNGIIVGSISYFEAHLLTGLTILFSSIVVVASAVLAGRWRTYLFITIVLLLNQFIVPLLEPSLQFNSFLEPLFLPLITIATTETIERLKMSFTKQVDRLEILNRVSQSLTSTLELAQVEALVGDAIQSSMSADTYYFGLLDNDQIRLELLYDDGEFFPVSSIDIEGSIAGWVITNRKPLLLTNVVPQSRDLGIVVQSIGQPRMSLSWMGAPILIGEKIVGLLAVASYEYDAFSSLDLELLKGIAQQAGKAMDNAYHHAEVERQSRVDSLTGVLNHGAFINALGQATYGSSVLGTSISVIMLDIDYFKQYNDRYGHLIGDKVLIELTRVIREHLRVGDLLGRWGGEEFAIALPNANVDTATMIARRIQSSLASLEITDRDGNTIPAPTVSQGIAVFPAETSDYYKLIDLADQRLYQVKEHNRGQIGAGSEILI